MDIRKRLIRIFITVGTFSLLPLFGRFVSSTWIKDIPQLEEGKAVEYIGTVSGRHYGELRLGPIRRIEGTKDAEFRIKPEAFPKYQLLTFAARCNSPGFLLADACITLLVCLVFARALLARDSIRWKVLVVATMTGVMFVEILTSLGDNLLVGAGGPLHAATASFFDVFVFVSGASIGGQGACLPGAAVRSGMDVYLLAFLMLNLYVYLLIWSSGILVDLPHKRKRHDKDAGRDGTG